MLIQSTPNSITLLPALPSQWIDGAVSGMRTRTGATVDFTWKNGDVTSAHIIPAADGEMTLIANGVRIPLKLSKGTPINLTDLKKP
ncbi:MAG: glycoside hydrolase family 95 protein, partial [Muribaculaceae bacterium]|nr:glycoside hydrolase family 95 protein [Muribaculaceae bacterium]